MFTGRDNQPNLVIRDISLHDATSPKHSTVANVRSRERRDSRTQLDAKLGFQSGEEFIKSSVVSRQSSVVGGRWSVVGGRWSGERSF